MVAVLAAVLLLSLRGGDSPTGSPLSPVALAAERTAAMPGARIAGTGEITGGAAQMTMSFTGAMSANGERAEMIMRIDSTTVPGAAAQIGEMRQVMDGQTMYMSSPAFTSALGGKTWMKIDMAELVGEMESDSAADARAWLEQLEATGPDPQLVGVERVRGVKTQHYAATIDPALAAAQLREEGQDDAAELLEAQATPSTVDVWIDRDDMVRRLAMTTGFELVAGEGAQMRMTMDLFDFGADPLIAVPPDDQVFDATELSEQALEQMTG